jgi:hypothetical protein
MGDWQPIDAAPMDGTEVLVWDGDHHWLAVWRCHEDVWWSMGEGVVFPTHWMPLPPPPNLTQA